MSNETSAVTHTPGPWVVVTTSHPHCLGGKHVERRIFTGWDHPQMKGPIGVVNTSVGLGAEKGGPAIHMVSLREEDARLIAAAPDLFEALQAAEFALREHGLTCHGVHKQMCAALAKAVGSSS